MSSEDQNSTRLGHHYDIDGVDPENVPMFAKTARIIGVVVVISFLIWGNFSGDYDSPFQDFADWLSRRNDEMILIFTNIIVALGGWIFRFNVGALVASAFFGGLSLITGVFKRI